MEFDEFMGPSSCSYNDAEYVIVPIPHDDNASWIRGASKGPEAIIRASYELEYYDYESGLGMGGVKYFTAKPIAFSDIKYRIKSILKDGKLPIALGGDHSISIPIMELLPREVSILHLDAHFDMRSEYEGNRLSHACSLYEASKNHNVVHVGARSACEEDISNAKKFNNIIASPYNISNIINQLGSDVYITFDVDVFDPSVMPATGTPEPGGIGWNDAKNIMESVCRERNVVGMDFVELSPQKGLHYCEIMVAKLIMKSMLCISNA